MVDRGGNRGGDYMHGLRCWREQYDGDLGRDVAGVGMGGEDSLT